ncbi:hypothetical protein ASPSYDRAFT_778440 [Aspergillus sydowii CBS 593.65]|uniref:Uncharacterized protein n=1 Tax=Aspergillus sydowii CBS 593.65 TaxID=1036612 RepID=A0A1L9TNA5_9EURO|nr:uncharacterized protein ASPSYDRAFT_778440 [Aspergillus sydowii CBS 593.65]OJJ60907.1 hypothetical protein ASPSYDRAFT_778440 [Aspergillus sydowii CBS 593.65]
MNMDDKYSQPPTYPTNLAFDPPPPYIPPDVQASEPVRDFKRVLVDQMDRWLKELDDIDWTVKNPQAGRDSDLDSDQTRDHESGHGLGPGHEGSHEHIRSHDTEIDSGENGDNDPNQTHSDSISDSPEDCNDAEDCCYEELSAIVNSGWARLRQVQDHMASFSHSLSEGSEL